MESHGEVVPEILGSSPLSNVQEVIKSPVNETNKIAFFILYLKINNACIFFQPAKLVLFRRPGNDIPHYSINR